MTDFISYELITTIETIQFPPR